MESIKSVKTENLGWGWTQNDCRSDHFNDFARLGKISIHFPLIYFNLYNKEIVFVTSYNFCLT